MGQLKSCWGWLTEWHPCNFFFFEVEGFTPSLTTTQDSLVVPQTILFEIERECTTVKGGKQGSGGGGGGFREPGAEITYTPPCLYRLFKTVPLLGIRTHGPSSVEAWTVWTGLVGWLA